ncbi:MAG: hypothetical protein EXR93_07020 [Gemmatimonadetes bacterium]|nr:hypothetical protein [Gemmatimonadota bacterium]
MRRLLAFLVLSFLATIPALAQTPKANAAPAAKQGGEEEEVERKIVGGGKIATGWTAKTDRDAPISKVKVETTSAGVHIETAASVVVYKPTDVLKRNYHLGASFTQNDGMPGHAEPYGLIFGGVMKGDTLAYTYFLIEGDGKFSVRRRTGNKSEDLASGWMEHKALVQMDKKGVATNKLLVERTSAGAVRFMVNGTEVFKTTAEKAMPDGFVGFRVGHNLSVDVASVMRMQM